MSSPSFREEHRDTLEGSSKHAEDPAVAQGPFPVGSTASPTSVTATYALSTPEARSRPSVPDAPPPNPPAKDLPTATPASSQTPSTRLPDVSEFDPFATPAPRPSTSAPQGVQPSGRNSDGDLSKQTPEPVFNFPGFLKDLRAKSAEPVARFLKRYEKMRIS
jgi:hypothetical protein